MYIVWFEIIISQKDLENSNPENEKNLKKIFFLWIAS